MLQTPSLASLTWRGPSWQMFVQYIRLSAAQDPAQDHVDADSGIAYEGYDPSITDIQGNRVGDPTGQTHAVLFFDYDEDGDPDLWVANDGDRLHVYRNDSSGKTIQFTDVSRDSSIGKAGAWMGFALADYDEDQDLDV